MFFLHIYKPQHKIQASHFIINRTIHIPLKSAWEQFPEHLHTRKKKKKDLYAKRTTKNVSNENSKSFSANKFHHFNVLEELKRCTHTSVRNTKKGNSYRRYQIRGQMSCLFKANYHSHTIHLVFQVRWSQNVQNLQIYPPKVPCTGLKKYPQDEHARKLKHDQRH